MDRIAVPSIDSGEVLVEVHATAITFAELGWDETWGHIPAIPGHEFSGVVAAVAPDVEEFDVGDEVFGLIRFELQGAAADYAAVPAVDLARKPAGLSHVDTAALPLAALTAWQALVDVAAVKSGDRVMVHGGAGGVGTFAIQIAKLLGAIVTATTRGEGAALVGTLGADVIVNTDEADFVLGGRRFDVVVDTIGGAVLERSYDVVVEGGRLVTLQSPPDQTLADRAGITATFFIVSPDVSELNHIADLAAQGKLKVVIAATFMLEEGRAAFETGNSGRKGPGKTILTVRK
jgi:NADPH:quinone reductase-like Zn-dependent oxidoreductase